MSLLLIWRPLPTRCANLPEHGYFRSKGELACQCNLQLGFKLLSHSIELVAALDWSGRLLNRSWEEI